MIRANTRKKLFSNYYFSYTVIFCILFVSCFFWFKLYNKSFFRSFDGLDQHYLIFLYIGKWFREVFRNIFLDHTFIIPMWDMSMGYGSDIFPTLGLYFPDPFNWISMLFPSEYAELGFNISIFLKFYFTGIAFSYFGFYKKYSKNTILLGAILYTFCATMYIAFIEAPFINPMYIFPFLIVGINKILNHESPRVYILSLGFSFINYFYFAYMMCIFSVGYCVLYYFTEYTEEKSVKNFLGWFFKFVGYSIIAIGLSMVVLLPILGSLLGQDRLSNSYFLPCFYELSFYKSLLLGFLSFYSMSGRDAIVGFGAIAIFGIGYLFLQRKRFVNQKIQFILLTIILCVPAFGSVMNGFSYYANRWIWAYALCVVNIICLTLPEFRYIDKSTVWELTIFLIAYFGVISLFLKEYNSLYVTTILLVVAMFIFLYQARNFREKTFQKGLIGFAMLCVTVQSYYWFSSDYNNATELEVESGTALNQITNGSGIPALSDISREDGVRFDECGLRVQTNANWISEVYGSDLYISIYNNDIVNFHNSLALNTSAAPQRIFGLNRRSELEYLTGTKYYLVPEGRTDLLPVGYSKLEKNQLVEGTNVLRYSNTEAVPMIFGYDRSVSECIYDELQPYERQQLLMRACVTEESTDDARIEFPDDELKVIEELPREIVKNEDGTYNVNSDGAEMVLRIPEVSESEIYVYFENINLEQDKKNLIQGYGVHVRAQYDGLDISNIEDSFFPNTNRSHMSSGKDDWMINLGYSSEKINTIIVHFNNVGTYSLDALRVYAKPRSEINASLDRLNRITDSVKIGTNEISAQLHINGNQYIYIAVPYSKGWKAELDGKPAEIIKANKAFMAIYAEEGDYELRLTFFTPYLKAGIIVSLISLVWIIILEWRYRKR